MSTRLSHHLPAATKATICTLAVLLVFLCYSTPLFAQITFPDGTTQSTAATGIGDSDWTISGNDMFSAVSGNVGIGTTTPSAKLDVNGSIKATGLDVSGGILTAPQIHVGEIYNDGVLAGKNNGLLIKPNWIQENYIWMNDGRVGINEFYSNVGLNIRSGEELIFNAENASSQNIFSVFQAGASVNGEFSAGQIISNSMVAGWGAGIDGEIVGRRANGSLFLHATSGSTNITNTVYIGAALGTEKVNISGAGQGIELGAGVAGKQFDAGKILYQKYTPNALELIGAGSEPSGLDRRIQMWAEAGLTVIGSITATGSITPGSSRAFKKDIADLTLDEALTALADLNPVKYRYKDEANGDLHLGFIAEDVPELVAIPSRKGVDPSDIVALLTKVVQQQQQQIQTLEARLDARR